MPERLLLDTHIFITGYSNPTSIEASVLRAVQAQADAILLLPILLEDQIRRVGRRVGGKDWAGLILSRIWHNFSIEYIALPKDPFAAVQSLQVDIPREDWLIFLTALQGRISIFVSGNRGFLRTAATQQDHFVCLSPDEFLQHLISE